MPAVGEVHPAMEVGRLGMPIAYSPRSIAEPRAQAYAGEVLSVPKAPGSPVQEHVIEGEVLERHGQGRFFSTWEALRLRAGPVVRETLEGRRMEAAYRAVHAAGSGAATRAPAVDLYV
ncbi:MAG: hypothetical protein D6721_01985 [Gammaproteobacteria bacterium]|nr:MAG: hypothetical protein D6721_01985 [Gammaproteobacteria bacterium]